MFRTGGLSLRDKPVLLSRYSEFWTRLSGLLPNARPSTPGEIQVDFDPEGRVGCLTATCGGDCALHFLQVPIKPQSLGKSTCEISIQFEQEIRQSTRGATGGNYEVIASVVRVHYRRTDTDRPDLPPARWAPSQVLAGLHYDMAFDPDKHFQRDHPLFHAQIDFGGISEQAIGTRCVQRQSQIKSGVPRVPTPPLDLPAVVYGILSDHFPTIVEGGWPPEMVAIVEKMPVMPCYPIGKRLGTSRPIQAPLWYPTARPGRP